MVRAKQIKRLIAEKIEGSSGGSENGSEESSSDDDEDDDGGADDEGVDGEGLTNDSANNDSKCDNVGDNKVGGGKGCYLTVMMMMTKRHLSRSQDYLPRHRCRPLPNQPLPNPLLSLPGWRHPWHQQQRPLLDQQD